MSFLSQGILSSAPFFYHQEGAGEPIIFIHGTPGRPQDFKKISALLTSSHLIFIPAMPGEGSTPAAQAQTCDISTRAQFVLETMKTRGITQAHFVGHSMGAATVAHIASHHPERCKKAVLISPIPLKPHQGWRRARPKLVFQLINNRLRFLFLPLLRLLFFIAGFPKGITKKHIFEVFRISHQFSFEEHSKNLLNMTQPTALIWCDDDPIIEKEALLKLSQQLPDGPRINFSTGGHAPYYHHAAQLHKELSTWLKG